LSETLKFSTSELQAWLEQETKSVFVPVHTKAKKLVDEMRKALDSLIDTSKMLLDNSGKEIEKRNMRVYKRARALNKLARVFVERYRQIRVPEQVTYDSAETFVQEVQKAFAVTDIDVRTWFPRISPFFILDRRRFSAVLEKAKMTLKELESYISKEYIKTKTLEDTFQLIEKLTVLEKQTKDLEEKKTKVGADKSLIQKQIDEVQLRMDDMKNTGGITQLNQTGDEIARMLEEVKHSLQHLQKPFIKLQSLATHGSGSGLTPEELNKLAQYLENPFEALSTEKEGYPLLRQILVKLNRFLSEDKLKLKPEKARKAQQVVIGILDNNSLDSLYQKCREVATRKARLSTSAEVAAAERELSKLNEHKELLKRNKGVIEGEELAISRNYTETLERIRNHKDEIQKNVLAFLNRKVVVA